MILLGYLSRDLKFSGSPTIPPDHGSSKKLTEVDAKLAEEQLECIKVFLMHVNFLFGWTMMDSASELGKYLQNPNNMKLFACSESNALKISRFEGKHRLEIDKKAGESGRFGGKPSWIFERIHDMAQSSIPIEVWDTAGYTGEVGGQEGASFEGWDWNGKNSGDSDEPRPGAKATRIWVRSLNKNPLKRGARYTVKPLLRRGENYIHELIVHGWHNVNFGYTPLEKPKEWGPKEWFFRSSHHNAFPHQPLKGGKHNLADIASDMLTFYMTVNQDWASFKLHNPAVEIGKFGKKMTPRLTIQGIKWLEEDWIRKWINMERRRLGQPSLQD